MRSVFAFVLLLAAPLQAEFRLSTLTEAQVGNLPGAQPSDLRTIYHQFSLDYAVADLQFGVRGETFGASASNRNYGELLQRSAVYRREGFEATVGNFYTIVGSGLLLHAFELPGVITEERGRRRRYQIVRDLDGVQVRYRAKRAEVLLLRGAPVNSTLPPGLEGVERRPDALHAGSLQLKPHPHFDVGFSAIRYAIGRGQETSAAFNARWRLASVLARLGLSGVYADVQGEYAQRDVVLKRFFSLDRSLGRALYLAATLASGPWGLSLEYKDYQDFALEHINNPPPLIREHSAYLLNRITHDVLADDEQGYQAELSYVLPSGQTLTANATRATRRRDPGAADDDVSCANSLWRWNRPWANAPMCSFLPTSPHNQILLDDKSRLLGTRWDVVSRRILHLRVRRPIPRRRSATQHFPAIPSASLHQSLLCSSSPPRPQPLRRRADSAHLRRIGNRGRSLWHHLVAGPQHQCRHWRGPHPQCFRRPAPLGPSLHGRHLL